MAMKKTERQPDDGKISGERPRVRRKRRGGAGSSQEGEARTPKAGPGVDAPRSNIRAAIKNLLGGFFHGEIERPPQANSPSRSPEDVARDADSSLAKQPA